MTFFQTIDRRSKRAMAEFLAGHFRYDTMNSWNASASYANNIKVHHVVPRELMDQAFEMLEVDDAGYLTSSLIADFDAAHNWRWQVGSNGRSGGYLVLYEGERKLSQSKSICTRCGQRNFKSTSENGTRCGRCGADSRVDRQLYDITTMPGRSTDMGMTTDDFLEWDIDSLRDRVQLVQEFDQLCDDVVAAFIDLCRNHEVVDETIYVPKTIKVLQEIEGN